MMTMSSISDTLVPPDPSKSAFLEFGGHGYPGHQQPSPGLSHNHYPVHGLHAVGPSQHDGPFSSGASSYGRPLGYPSYHSPVSAHHPGAYLPYQHGGHGGALGHTRLEDAGRFTKELKNINVNTFIFKKSQFAVVTNTALDIDHVYFAAQ